MVTNQIVLRADGGGPEPKPSKHLSAVGAAKHEFHQYFLSQRAWSISWSLVIGQIRTEIPGGGPNLISFSSSISKTSGRTQAQ
jgi:hypothetical protein